jgi:hypothetical protein
MSQDIKNIISTILISTLILYPILGMIALATYTCGILLMFGWNTGKLWLKITVTFITLAIVFIYFSSFTLVANNKDKNLPKPANVRNITNF